MTENEAYAILHPDTTAKKIAEIEYYAGLRGKEAAIKAVEDACIVACESMVQLALYETIGTIEEFKALKEKNTPKKGIPYTSSNNHKFVECPSCHKDMDLYYDFCQYCGQAVDWGKSKT